MMMMVVMMMRKVNQMPIVKLNPNLIKEEILDQQKQAQDQNKLVQSFISSSIFNNHFLFFDVYRLKNMYYYQHVVY